MATGPTGAPPEAFGARIASSTRWVTASTLTSAVTTFAATVVLSRLLDRHQFGLAALAMLAMAVFQLFQDSGLHAALIQRRERIRQAADTASLYAPLTGAFLGGLCIAAAPLAARFFHQPDVEPLVRGLAVILFIRSFAIVPSALIQRELLFARRSVISITGSLLNLGAATALAVSGAGAWSVIGAQIVSATWASIAYQVAAPYRANPRRASLAELRELLRYGRHILAANVFAFVNSNTDSAAIGRLDGPVPLGTYAIGYRTGTQAVTLVTAIANVLVFPAYAKLQSDLPRFGRAYLRSLRLLCVISPPIAFGLAAVSSVLVPVVYGSRWNDAVPVLVLISFHGLVLSVAATTGEVLKAGGRPGLFFGLNVLQVVLLFALIGVLYPFGILGFAGARTGATLITSAVALVLAGRLLELRLREWARALREPFVAGLLMGAAVVATRFALAPVLADAPLLILLVAEGAILYPLLLRALAPDRWHEFLEELGRIAPLHRLASRLTSGRSLPLPSASVSWSKIEPILHPAFLHSRRGPGWRLPTTRRLHRGDRVTIGQLARAVWHHRLLVAALTAALMGAVAFVVNLEQPSYRTSTELQVQAPLDATGVVTLQGTLSARERAVTIASLGNTREVEARIAKKLRQLGGVQSCSITQSGQSEFLWATCTGSVRQSVAPAANAYAAALQAVLEQQLQDRIQVLTAQYKRQIDALRKDGVPATNFPTQPIFPSYRELEVVQTARTPAGAYAPRPLRTLMIAFVLGLLVNAGLAVALEHFQNRARTPEALEDAIGEPVLGTIPRLGRDTSREVRMATAVAPRRHAAPARAGAGDKA